MHLLLKPMYDDLPRHTLIRKKDGGIFLIKCKINQVHGNKLVPCYIGHQYMDEEAIDYAPGTCYIDSIDQIINYESTSLEVQ
jgi:hypothetical protein